MKFFLTVFFFNNRFNLPPIVLKRFPYRDTPTPIPEMTKSRQNETRKFTATNAEHMYEACGLCWYVASILKLLCKLCPILNFILIKCIAHHRHTRNRENRCIKCIEYIHDAFSNQIKFIEFFIFPRWAIPGINILK